LIRSNKFTLETVLYKVGEDSMSDAFSRAADASDSPQVVLIFPTLQEEFNSSTEDQKMEQKKQQLAKDAEEQRKKEEEERDKLKTEWLNLLFTEQSVAAMGPEGPLQMAMEAGNTTDPISLVVWVGDNPKEESKMLKELTLSDKHQLVSFAWSLHPAGEAYNEFSLTSPEVTDGSFYLRGRGNFENQDLDMLHDVELLGRSLTESIQTKIDALGIEWRNVTILGFGKGAGIALYSSLLKVFPQAVAGMVLFSPIVLFPSFLGEKLTAVKEKGPDMKVFSVWGGRNRSTPGTYRQLLTQTLRSARDVQHNPDIIQDGVHAFDSKSLTVLTSMLSLITQR